MPHTQQNGVAERWNRTIIEHDRSIATASKCPAFLWTELINIATHLINLSPTCSNHGITPNQVYYQIQSRIDHLHIFGSVCYLHVPKEIRSKLDSKTQKCFFLGYDE
jgi:hypothetical protein